jgi:hypothetical protein
MSSSPQKLRLRLKKYKSQETPLSAKGSERKETHKRTLSQAQNGSIKTRNKYRRTNLEKQGESDATIEP